MPPRLTVRRQVSSLTADMTLQRKKKKTWGRGLLLCCLLLWVSGGGVSGVNLRRFVGCAVREFTFLAKKPGCKAMHVTTDACWGRCETWEKPVVDRPYVQSHQTVCTYNESKLITVKLQCQSDVDPSYTYPEALTCHCGVCVTRTTECLTFV
ncbi:glycoprotein hormone beta-5 [Solea senegalensis]|uniref:Glycoprotein hormone beta-5 n=1 Tax=Solea senegalensis TaxID=28829 RepID=A0AAV6S1B1_SOLSE|nr:glycoprotein hormone beta-5 [Solea senegalensis]KAG7511094.1 glycoprotein hormone beta-5 [Solea senegalensis]